MLSAESFCNLLLGSDAENEENNERTNKQTNKIDNKQ